jgi:hypothetical protein
MISFLTVFFNFKKIWAFINAHKRIILVLLILGYCLISWHLAVKIADKAKGENNLNNILKQRNTCGV